MSETQEEKRQVTEQEAQALNRLANTIHIHDALVAIQTGMKAPKDKQQKKKDGSVGYSYRSAESILEAAKPWLQQFRLTITMKDEIIQVGDRYYDRASATLSNGFETIVSSFDTLAPERSEYMSEQQTSGSTASYGRKYALQGLFALDDAQDPDSKTRKEDPKANGEIVKWLTNALNQMPDIIDKNGKSIPAWEAFLGKYKLKALADLTQSQAEKAKEEIMKKAAQHKNDNPA